MYEFILLKMKCFALQLSPAWDFLLTCLGMSYVLWNPFLFAVFNVRFQQAAREFIKEEVIQINSYDDKKKKNKTEKAFSLKGSAMNRKLMTA
jgi:hypothetical protein